MIFYIYMIVVFWFLPWSSFVWFVLFRVQEDHPIMSFTVSKNGRLALLNVATQVSSQILGTTEVWLALHTTCLTIMGLFSASLLRECTCGTSKTGCWWGSTKVWPRASTQSTPVSEDTTKTSLPVAAKVQQKDWVLCSCSYIMGDASNRWLQNLVHSPVLTRLSPLPQTTKCTSGTGAASFQSLSSQATHAPLTVWAGTRPSRGSWPPHQTTAQYAFGVRRPSSTRKRLTDSTVKVQKSHKNGPVIMKPNSNLSLFHTWQCQGNQFRVMSWMSLFTHAANIRRLSACNVFTHRK